MGTTLSRRRLGFGALGATLIGSGAAAQNNQGQNNQGTRLSRQLPWTFAPLPVQGGTPVLSNMGGFHVFLLAAGTEPSSIGNFKGNSGGALISGTVTRTNINTGEQQLLPFTDADMRFMQGTFVGADGNVQNPHQGTFGFV